MEVKLKPLAEQVIVITGASSGIGLATAKAAAKKGAKVVLASRNAEALLKIEQEIRANGGEATYVVADVSKREDVQALAAAAKDAYGSFDTWVNNAGVGIFGGLEEVSEADNRQLFDINFWGLVYGTQVAAENLKAGGGGAIINLGSVVSDIGFPVQGMYSASKHAVQGFTDAFRMEMLSQGAPISVTLIKPAAIDTPFPIHARNYLPGKPELPPPVYQPEDVAGAVLAAAERGGREYYVGGAGKLMSSLNKHLPGIVDWFGANFITRQSVRNEPAGRNPEGALHQAGTDGATGGDTGHFARRSVYTVASEHPMLTGAAVTALSLAALSLRSFGSRYNRRDT